MFTAWGLLRGGSWFGGGGESIRNGPRGIFHDHRGSCIVIQQSALARGCVFIEIEASRGVEDAG